MLGYGLLFGGLALSDFFDVAAPVVLFGFVVDADLPLFAAGFLVGVVDEAGFLEGVPETDFFDGAGSDFCAEGTFADLVPTDDGAL